VGRPQWARMAHALHLRAEEIYSAVLECVAVDWDGGALPGQKSGKRVRPCMLTKAGHGLTWINADR